MFSIKGHKPSFWHYLNSQVISISCLPIGWLLTLGCQIAVFPIEISDDFSKYLSVNGVIIIMVNTHRTVCGWNIGVHSTKTFGFTEYVLEKTNANYNACFICALLNIPIEYFSREGVCKYWIFLCSKPVCMVLSRCRTHSRGVFLWERSFLWRVGQTWRDSETSNCSGKKCSSLSYR